MAAAWTTDDIPDQSGRVAVVTGANSGLGYQVALALAVAGAEVVLACRNVGKAESALASIRAQARPPGCVSSPWIWVTLLRSTGSRVASAPSMIS